FEASRPTTHDEPTYRVHESVFYCVANMPGAVPHTSTYALTNVTLPYITAIAAHGWRDALRADPALALGLSTHEGTLTCQPVAEAHGLSFPPAGAGLRCARTAPVVPRAGTGAARPRRSAATWTTCWSNAGCPPTRWPPTGAT